MANHFYTHNTLHNVARTMDPATQVVAGSVGVQPTTFVASDWTDHGDAYLAKQKFDAEFNNLRPKKDKGSAAKVYRAAIDAGNTVEVARQISGYTGK